MRRLPRKGVALLAAAVGAMGLTRMRGARRRPDPGPRATTDEVIARRVEAHLRQEFDAKAEDFSIKVRRGRVILRGEATDLGEIRRLEAEIDRIDGVAGVDNLLRLRIGSTPVIRGGPSEVEAWLS